MLDVYLSMLDLAYFELGEAFKGLKDEHVWKRPAEGLLSVGELAGHISYWEANKFTGEAEGGKMKPDLSKCKLKSPLIDQRFAYYPGTLETPPSDEHLAMTAEQVHAEMVRIHNGAMEHLKAANPDLDAHVPGYPAWATYREFLKYAIFHCSYHTGQMYSARHLLGENPPDN